MVSCGNQSIDVRLLSSSDVILKVNRLLSTKQRTSASQNIQYSQIYKFQSEEKPELNLEEKNCVHYYPNQIFKESTFRSFFLKFPLQSIIPWFLKCLEYRTQSNSDANPYLQWNLIMKAKIATQCFPHQHKSYFTLAFL